MRFSKLKIKTLRDIKSEETSKGTTLLLRARYVVKVGSGIYEYLPFGLRVLQKISKIIREEMEKIGGIEIVMPALHPKKYWQQTNRWQKFDALFKLKSRFGQEFALGATHEEIITPLAKEFIHSYKDLPLFLYQIQTKFRDEPRAKSGLLRCKEFLMKDLYSFHRDEADLDKYYEKVKKSYQRIFRKIGLASIIVEASGGTFSKFSHEFQVISPVGEDTIFYCPHCHFARNKEIVTKLTKCPICDHPLQQVKAIEVGNIFKLKEQYSRAFNLKYKDRKGEEHFVSMGCYGIGISRLLGVLAEIYNDDQGLTFPKSVSPYQYHLLSLYGGDKKTDKKIKQAAEKLYDRVTKAGKEILFDDRENVTNGEKLKDADLIGIPYRVVISQRTLKRNSCEIKPRTSNRVRLIKLTDFVKITNNL